MSYGRRVAERQVVYEAAYLRSNCLEGREYVGIIVGFDECCSDANGRNEY